MTARRVDATAAAIMGEVLLVCGRAQAMEVKLTVSEPDGVARAPAVPYWMTASASACAPPSRSTSVPAG